MGRQRNHSQFMHTNVHHHHHHCAPLARARITLGSAPLHVLWRRRRATLSGKNRLIALTPPHAPLNACTRLV